MNLALSIILLVLFFGVLRLFEPDRGQWITLLHMCVGDCVFHSSGSIRILTTHFSLSATYLVESHYSIDRPPLSEWLNR